MQAKYEHLIGKEAAVEAARKTEANKSYGMVSAESKKDKRTVEQVKLPSLFILSLAHTLTHTHSLLSRYLLILSLILSLSLSLSFFLSLSLSLSLFLRLTYSLFLSGRSQKHLQKRILMTQKLIMLIVIWN